MTPPLVSIVIPVFNVERHLRQCLDSVLRQTLKEWECICIDDGLSLIHISEPTRH